MAGSAQRVVAFGLAPSAAAAVAATAGPEVRLVTAGPGTLDRALREHEPTVLVAGPGLPAAAREALLAPGLPAPPRLVLAAGAAEYAGAAEHLGHARLFYLARGPLGAAEVAAITRAALDDAAAVQRAPEIDGPGGLDPARWGRLLACAHVIAEQLDLGVAGAAIARAILELLAPARAYCLLYDEEADVLWSREGPLAEPRRESAAAGLTSWVARTGTAVALARPAGDPRWDRAADDPGGSGDDPLLAVPARAPDGRVLAVLVAVGGGGSVPLAPDDHAALRGLADRCAPLLAHLRARERIAAERRAAARALRGPVAACFSEAALEYHAGRASRRGPLLRVAPRWTPGAVGALAVLGLGALAAALLPVERLVEGPAVVRDAGPAGGVLLALLPGPAGPELRPGLPLHFAGAASGRPALELRIAAVGAPLPPAEGERLLGAAGPAGPRLAGPVVPVRALVDGGPAWRDGLTGTARVRVRAGSALTALVRPGGGSDAR
jgi:hypothetical protein